MNLGPQHPFLTRTGAGILLAIGITFTVLSAQLPTGSFVQPDAGTWPLMVGIALVFFAAISLLLPERDAEALDTPHSEVWRFSLSLAMCSLFAVLFSLAGYFIAISVFVFAIAKVFAKPTWWQAALIGMATGVGIWVLFGIVLGLPGP
jgi:hypothetical protein